jgi:hypothetical protein
LNPSQILQYCRNFSSSFLAGFYTTGWWVGGGEGGAVSRRATVPVHDVWLKQSRYVAGGELCVCMLGTPFVRGAHTDMDGGDMRAAATCPALFEVSTARVNG